MNLGITTFRIVTLSKMGYFALHKNSQQNRYAECHVLIVILGVLMLNFVLLNAALLSVFMRVSLC